MNVMITSAGKRVSLVKEFQSEARKRNKNNLIYTCDLKPELSPACYLSDKSFIVPPASSPDYVENLLKICEKNSINIIVPTIDPELLVLSENKRLFEQIGVEVVISDPEFIVQCRDKKLTHKYFDSIGVNRATDVDINNPSFPFFVKPSDGSCSVGAFKVSNPEGLKEIDFENTKNMFLEYLDPKEHTEYTIDLYFNRDSELSCCVPRKRIEVRAGEVNKGMTLKNFLIPYVMEKFKKVPGVYGCINFQVFVNHSTDNIYGVEINPRFGGGYPLSYLAGANYPGWIIDEYADSSQIDYFDGWESNLLMLRYDDEVLVHDFSEL